jgi:hypothetical protein
MKRLIFVTLVIAVVSAITEAKYSGGSGTSGDPYEIGTVADLLALGNTTGDYDANFVLTADINLAGYTFTAAVIAPNSSGSDFIFDSTKFTGIFDGAGHTISNLTINTHGIGNDYLGLFGFVGSGGKIENLQLEDFSITGGNGSAFIGGLAGEDAGTISSCFSDSAVTGGNNSFYMGGLVGVEVNEGNIIDSYSEGTVSGGNDANYIGGLAGGIYGNGVISMCFSTSDVTGGNNSSYIGGLVGKNYLGSIVNCYSTGTVTSEAYCMSIGGLAGINFWGSIENCYSTDTVSVGVNNTDIGGLVGTNLTNDGNGIFVSNSYFLDTAGPNNGIGTPLTNTQMKQQSNFVGWDFSSVWQISESVDYPELAWQSICTPPSSAPTGVSASDGTYNYVQVTWDSVSGATGYEVWRSTSNNSGSASKLGDSTTSPFDDSSVTHGMTYYYWVKAKNTCGTSDFSSSDQGSPSSCVLPSSLTGVSATDGTYNNYIRVTWNLASGATGYEVWRNTSNNSGTAIKSGDCTLPPYDDYNVIEGTTYYYWIKSQNSCGTNDFSLSDSGYVSTNLKTVPIIKCAVTAGSKVNRDKISFSGTMGATADDFNDANSVMVTIRAESAVDMDPCVFTFPVNHKTFKKGKFKSTITSKPSKMSFAFNTKKKTFSFSARNIHLTGLSCPVGIEIKVGDWAGTAAVNEAIVNGPRRPIPIKLLMGVKNSLRVDKSKFTRNKKTGNITHVVVRGGFSVKDINDANLVANQLDIVAGSQTFTIPPGKFKNTKGKFTCSKVELAGGIVAATFNSNKCTFTLTIKGTKITDPKGTAEFKMEFGDFSEGAEVSLP